MQHPRRMSTWKMNQKIKIAVSSDWSMHKLTLEAVEVTKLLQAKVD